MESQTQGLEMPWAGKPLTELLALPVGGAVNDIQQTQTAVDFLSIVHSKERLSDPSEL